MGGAEAGQGGAFAEGWIRGGCLELEARTLGGPVLRLDGWTGGGVVLVGGRGTFRA